LQAEGRKVCFVGDGINDSIALKTANVSISLHGATTIAIDTAHIVLMEGDLVQLPTIFTLADEFAANMRVNFLAATLPCVLILGGAFFPPDLLLSQQIERVHATLIEEVMGSNVDNIVLVSAQAMQWSDSSLGCPQPGMVYAQVITGIQDCAESRRHRVSVPY
jgi:cation transport ATPase